MINYSAGMIGVRGDRNAVLRRDALNACALSRLSTRRFAKRRTVGVRRGGAMCCR
jgi:hypothetical protein